MKLRPNGGGKGAIGSLVDEVCVHPHLVRFVDEWGYEVRPANLHDVAYAGKADSSK